MKKFKAVLYPFILFCGLAAAVCYSNRLINPKVNLNQLVEQVKDGKSVPYYRSHTGFLRMTPDFYVAALYTEKDAGFHPVKYLLITRTPTSIHVDLISGAGVENSRTLADKEAIDYLTSKKIAYQELDALWQQRK